MFIRTAHDYTYIFKIRLFNIIHVCSASQANMFGGQQQGFGQPRPAQPDFRQMAGNPRAPYMQQAPNVTMNANMGAMGGMGSQGIIIFG